MKARDLESGVTYIGALNHVDRNPPFKVDILAGVRRQAIAENRDLRSGRRYHRILVERALKVASKIGLRIRGLLMFLFLSLRDGVLGLFKGILKVLRLAQAYRTPRTAAILLRARRRYHGRSLTRVDPFLPVANDRLWAIKISIDAALICLDYGDKRNSGPL